MHSDLIIIYLNQFAFGSVILQKKSFSTLKFYNALVDLVFKYPFIFIVSFLADSDYKHHF